MSNLALAQGVVEVPRNGYSDESGVHPRLT